MKESLVSFNITSDNKLLNKTNVPYLFYWDGESNVVDSILIDPGFKSFLNNVVMNVQTYPNAKLSMFYFKYDGDKEIYNDNTYYIQNLIKLASIDDDTRAFYKEYLWKHFTYLYQTAYHENYEKEFNLFEVDECILDIYDKIQKKYPKRVIKTTVINYIRGEMQSKDGLNLENCDWIIFELEKLLTERD